MVDVGMLFYSYNMVIVFLFGSKRIMILLIIKLMFIYFCSGGLVL